MNYYENTANLFLYEEQHFSKRNTCALYEKNIHKNNKRNKTSTRVIEIFGGELTDVNQEIYPFYGHN